MIQRISTKNVCASLLLNDFKLHCVVHRNYRMQFVKTGKIGKSAIVDRVRGIRTDNVVYQNQPLDPQNKVVEVAVAVHVAERDRSCDRGAASSPPL